MGYLFTSESVSEGHPDKVSDQISDALLDEFIRRDPESKVACETLVTTGLTVLSGEVRTSAYVDVQQVARDVIRKIGYTKAEYMFDADSCGVVSAIHEQSPDINQGVVRKKEEEQGAGDQGMMFGYACDETNNYMPISLEIANQILIVLADIRKRGREMKYLRPDSKSQVTVAYDDNGKPEKIETIVVSTQHDEFDSEKRMQQRIKTDIQNILLPRVIKKLPARVRKLFDGNPFKLFVNPTGKFVIGGPHGDTGLTGRKIIVDTYGGRGAHGGGAFSGKDPSKVDRSAAYAARHIAKNAVAAGIASEMLVQVAYAIGISKPVGFYVNTYGSCRITDQQGNTMSDSEVAYRLEQLFDMRPAAIINRFKLKNPIFLETASYGHLGRKPFTRKVELIRNNQSRKVEVEFFGWEKLDYVDKIKKAFK